MSATPAVPAGLRGAAIDRAAAATGVLVAALTATCLLAADVGVYVVNGAGLLVAMLTAGLAMFAVLPETAPAAATLRRLVSVGAVATFGIALLGLPFLVMTIDGRGLAGLGDGLARDVVLRSGDYGSALMRCAGAVVCVLAVRLATGTRPWRALLLAGAVLIAGSFLLTGHTRTHGPAAVVIACGLAHVVAAAAWLGGVVGLGLTLRRVRGAAAARLLTTFAGLMAGVVTMLLAGGLGLAMLYLPSASALVDTAYGQVLLVKSALVGAVLLLAATNHRRLVPLAADGHADAVDRIRINVVVEQVVLVAVVLITDILMRQNPGG